MGLLYNWILVNHYPLVLSPGALCNQVLIIDSVNDLRKHWCFLTKEMLLQLIHFGDESGYETLAGRRNESKTYVSSCHAPSSPTGVMACAVWEGSLRPFISHLKALIQRAACTDLLQNQNQKPLQFELTVNIYSITEHSGGPGAESCL